MWDLDSAGAGHALVVLRCHVTSWFEATRREQISLLDGIDIAGREIEARHMPQGFSVGINVGEVAGRTVGHLHVHVVPQYASEVREQSRIVDFDSDAIQRQTFALITSK